MLYLNPPYHIINGVALFRDHADKLQYYFLPIAPHLTMLKDPASGKRIPQILVIRYRGRAGGGGLLDFDVNLGIESNALDDIRSELQSLDRLRQPPRLAPVLLADGTVKMMLFGKESGATAPTEGATGPNFVLKMSHHTKPALYGDNQATFSVQLDQEGITILEQALRGEMSPIGVVYSLDFLALRPAYSVRLHIDWDRVQKHMNEHFSTQFFFSSTEIDKTVDELVDKRMIVLEADTFVPEGEDSSGIISRRDQALNEVRDMITNAFFEPSLNPIKQEKDGWDKATQAARDISLLAVTGGWASVASFSYKKIDYTRIDKKALNVNISERTTVKRSIFPQGHLTGLFRVFEREGLDPKRFIMDVDIDDKFFERRRVEVIARDSFEEDSIGEVSVSLRYGNESESVLLESTAARKTVDWASIITNNVMQQEVSYSYKVTFKDIDTTERPAELSSPEVKTTTDAVSIGPRGLYSIVPVSIMAPTSFPWKRFPLVEVQTRYTDEANAIRLTDTFLLKEQQAEQRWKMFVMDPLRKRFEYKLVFRAANNKDITMPWVETDEEQVMVRDPYPMKRTLWIVPSFNWDEVDRAFVDVSYEDKPNRISEVDSFEFNKDAAATKTFSVDLRNPDLRLVAYQVTVLFKDGITYEVPRSFTLENRIFINKSMLGQRIVTVRPVAADFAKKKAKTMKVEMRYEDAANGLSFNEVFNFDEKTLNGLGYFEYKYSEKPHYEYRVIVRFQSGLSKTTNWQKVNLDELVVPIN